MTSVLSEYLKIFEEYKKKYGNKIAVLMCVGSFFELYGVDNGMDKFGNARKMSQVLNIVLTRKNKKVIGNSMQNPLMLGFPCVALSKYVPILLNDDYTVVVADQVKAGMGFRRHVTEVISPSTYIDSSDDDNYMLLIHVDKHQHIGMSALSVLTGSSIVHECYSDKNDKDMPFDDALAFIKQYRPREIALSGEITPSLTSYLELDDILCHKIPNNKNSHNVAYQNAVLGCAFDNNSMLSNIEFVDLERTPHALLSYVLLIEFVHGHNPMLLRRMSKPELFTCREHLMLSTSTLDQLNVTSQTKSKHTLFNVINKCSTKAGKRLLLKRLTAPIVDPRELCRRYNQVDEFGCLFEHEDIEKILKRVADIEKLQRRLTVGIMTPPELAGLAASYSLILELDNVIKSRKPEHIPHMGEDDHTALRLFVDACAYAFDMDAMSTCDAETATFNSRVFKDLDSIKDKIKTYMDAVNGLAAQVSGYGIEGGKVEFVQNVGYFVAISSLRAKKIPGSSGLIVRHNKATARVTSDLVEAANKDIQSLNADLKTLTKKRYTRTLEYLSSLSSALTNATIFVSIIDVIKSNFITKKLYNYCRPTVMYDEMQSYVEEHGMRGYCTPDTFHSFVDAKNLRHAVIERIDDGNEYVPNDVALDGNGIILYSMNSCGKTSLLRALGLSVILAQAGCFVPASSYRMHPFCCIMTRILSRDNIMKGQSSFVAEMSELRAILKRANDSSTLVLADEITHGTEHTSGSAIFVSSVETLADRRVNFLFTTHLHNVYPFVRDVHNVRVCHLSVTFSANGTKSITFERKLNDGPGGSMYGLEVCQYLNMDTKFLARAFQIRDEITPDKTENLVGYLAKLELSPYNKKKIKVKCESCGYRPRLPTDQPLHTHHIKEQHMANNEGMIGGIHKDAASNLMVLCHQCHNKAHAN